MSEPPETFATHLRRELDRAGVSAAGLAKQIGTSRATVYNLLSGAHRPSFDLACRIADALGVSVDTLRGKP